jgi:hypothetical protein
MARFGRKSKTADSTTVAQAPEAESQDATVVKPARTRRGRPTPPPAPEPEAPPILSPEIEAEIEAYHADPTDVVEDDLPSTIRDHDEEW